MTVRWRAFSLAALNEGPNGREIPRGYRAVLEASARALRLVEALAAEDRHRDAGRFYTELGHRTHAVGTPLRDRVVRAAAEAAGLEKEAHALDDESWDEAVRSSHDTAYAAAGPDVGSPVLVADGAARGLFGPVLAEVPDRRESVALWDSVETLLRSGAFLEVKRGRP